MITPWQGKGITPRTSRFGEKEGYEEEVLVASEGSNLKRDRTRPARQLRSMRDGPDMLRTDRHQYSLR